MKQDAIDNILQYKKRVDEILRIAETGNIKIQKVNLPIKVPPRQWQAELLGNEIVYKVMK